MKHKVAAMKIHYGEIFVNGIEAKLNLPDGCLGILFVFESKKKAREFWGENVPLLRIEERTKSRQELEDADR